MNITMTVMMTMVIAVVEAAVVVSYDKPDLQVQ
jgi:hypothetical protein